MTITTEEAERIAEEATQALSAASTSRPRYMPGIGGQTLDATAKGTLRRISDWHLESLFEAVHALRALAAERDQLSNRVRHIERDMKERAEVAEAEAERLRAALERLVKLNDEHSPFGGEMYHDRVEWTWEAARIALEGGKDADQQT